MKNSQRKGFTFYRSYEEAISMLPAEEQLAIYKAITTYALDGTMPNEESLSLCARLAWIAFLPNLQADRQRYHNACKGGAARSNKNATQEKPQQPAKEESQQPVVQEDSQQSITHEGSHPTTQEGSQPHSESASNVNVDVKENEKVNVKENENVNVEGSASSPSLTGLEISLKKFEKWAGENAPTLLHFVEPMTAHQFAELRKVYPDKRIISCAEQMHNKSAYQHNRSAYLTMKKWIAH